MLVSVSRVVTGPAPAQSKCERGVLIWRRGNCGFERIHDGRTFAVGRDHV